MHERFMDAMSIVNETGKPDLFITFTCNPNDPDILKGLKPWQTPSDRPDIVARVFEIKKNFLLNLILNEKIFGTVIGYCWVIEYQKRGLPHLHLLITLDPKDKWHSTDDIDNFISAMIPDSTNEPELFEVVTKFMIHGPCNENSQCWDKTKQKCKKKFPKPFMEKTRLNDDGYPFYKRVNDGRFVYKKGIKVTNEFVVPYNSFLSKTFYAHINVERVADISAVKYLYDYIYKGYDAAIIECTTTDESGQKMVLKYDEVGSYLEARYLSPCEACWRIFKFPMYGKSHSVDLLDVHLENKQNIFYKKFANDDEIEEAAKRDSTLTAYFKFCQLNPSLKIKYIDMPKFCTWDKKTRKWKYPREGKLNKIGRLAPLNPTDTEKYYLRYLLLNDYGQSFADLKTFEGVEYPTFAEACLARGLTRDDDEWHKCMEEASLFSRKHPRGLRILFVNILIHCSPKYPEKLWDCFKDHMTQDLKKRFKEFHNEKIYQKGLELIEKNLNYQEKSLTNFKTMPQLEKNNVLIDEEELYDPIEEKENANQLKNMLNGEQLEIVNEILPALEKENIQKCVFIDGPGGTGKSFILKTIYHLARANKKTICNMAFSGVAATILKKGRTLHNRFKLPLNISKNSTSGIENNGKEADEIRATHIFIWDEAPMAPRFILDIIDLKLKELMGNNLPFGGKTMILSGDFRQCLPIKEFATRSEIADLIIKKSKLWKYFKILKLTKNMRADPNEKEFADELIKIGNGNSIKNGYVTVPTSCICNGDLVNEIFGDIIKENKHCEFSERAILSPFNSIVDQYNEEIMNLLDGDIQTYLSIDETESNNLPVTPEILNSLKCQSLPNYKIEIKKNSMVMLLRNLNVKEGLCNGTRLQVLEMGKHVVNCLIKSGDRIGENTLIPRITLIEEKKFPFLLRRHQFPLRPAFAFTINKSQSQTFSKIGLDYSEPPFSHGQTYVALSRAKSWSGIKIKNHDNSNLIKNIVWEEIINH